MTADGPFFDTSYLVRLYLEDHGFEVVRALAGTGPVVAAAWHARPEVIAALHRAFRERGMAQAVYHSALDQFASDNKAGLFHWLPLSEDIVNRVEAVLRRAPASLFLRGADALHLACAAEHGFAEVHSNDRRFLDAAPLFGLRGINVIENNRE